MKDSFWDRDFKPKNFLEVVIAVFSVVLLAVIWYNAIGVQTNYKNCMKDAGPNCYGICRSVYEKYDTTWLEGSEVVCGCEFNTYWSRNLTKKDVVKEMPGDVIFNFTRQ